jgi:hypothetical protein
MRQRWHIGDIKRYKIGSGSRLYCAMKNRECENRVCLTRDDEVNGELSAVAYQGVSSQRAEGLDPKDLKLGVVRFTSRNVSWVTDCVKWSSLCFDPAGLKRSRVMEAKTPHRFFDYPGGTF